MPASGQPYIFAFTHENSLRNDQIRIHGLVRCDVYLSAERAGVLGVLCDFHLLHHLPERGSIPGPVLPRNPNLLRPLGLKSKVKQEQERGSGI
jgi:hypothetical protein